MHHWNCLLRDCIKIGKILFIMTFITGCKMEHRYIEKTENAVIYQGHIVNPVGRTIEDGEVCVVDGQIQSITCRDDVPKDAPYIMPGFVDAHVHVESSMVLPSAFADVAVRHGVLGAVCDPHEIANVLGEEGVEIMLESARKSRFHFAFGAPSCVPSCGISIETSGCQLDSVAVGRLLAKPEIYFLSEMMNFPGVLGKDAEVMKKIQTALQLGKPVDGHAPGLSGEARRQYAEAGISTDHECTSLDEARDAVKAGMYVIIREGSAAKDYKALAPLLSENPSQVMFCMDDCHPDDLINGEIDIIVRNAIRDGYPLMDILRSACVLPVSHYHLPIGLLQKGDAADFICVSDLTPDFKVLQTVIKGEVVYDSETTIKAEQKPVPNSQIQNNFQASPIALEDLTLPSEGKQHIIVAADGSLFTQHEEGEITDDVQKLVVYSRYKSGASPQVAYVRGFGLRKGAIAQTIAHDCHNIVALGTDDALLVQVINQVVAMRGGIVATDGTATDSLSLPIAGIMSPMGVEEVVEKNRRLLSLVRNMGCTLHSPFITLAFMALPVIPQLKLTDKGLFDSSTFSFIR